MTRRGFLALVGGALTAAAGAVIVVRDVAWRRIGRGVRRLERYVRDPGERLRDRYAWLGVDPGAFERYLADWQEAFGPLQRRADPGPEFFTRFLLSTDFFDDPELQKSGGPVHYTGFFEPGGTACYNPFAQPPPSDAELGRTARS